LNRSRQRKLKRQKQKFGLDRTGGIRGNREILSHMLSMNFDRINRIVGMKRGSNWSLLTTIRKALS
jgi:hypothetical protein